MREERLYVFRMPWRNHIAIANSVSMGEVMDYTRNCEKPSRAFWTIDQLAEFFCVEATEEAVIKYANEHDYEIIEKEKDREVCVRELKKYRERELYRITKKKEIFMQLLDNGDNKIFSNWKEVYKNLTKEEFKEAYEWLYSDPLTFDGRVTRKLAVTEKGLVYLAAIISGTGEFIYTNWVDVTEDEDLEVDLSKLYRTANYRVCFSAKSYF